MMGLLIVSVAFVYIVFALGIGFAILFYAVKQDTWVKTVGQIFGWFIIVISTFLILLTAFSAGKFMDEPSTCPFMQQMMQQKRAGKRMQMDGVKMKKTPRLGIEIEDNEQAEED